MIQMEKIVRFFDAEMRANETEDMAVEGYALKFDKVTQIGSDKYGWKEKISRTALDGAKLDDVVLNFNHSFDNVLARTTSRSLQLTVDTVGLRVAAKIVDTTVGRDVFKLIQNGLINRMSFAAVIKESVWTISENDTEMDLREITAFERFYDVAAVTFPAYEDTLIAARSELTLADIDVLCHFEKRGKARYDEQIKLLNQIIGGIHHVV